ncbi:hypothetical protein D5R81_01365 [Parashewanella spongiae]|uniref:Peptidase C58 YopT-type domain-containing protein n=1 Tax=Parashewanella spongiae TaxID=342950 RepID=A0A3A6UJG6_9GAMM|nr:YopT-type cysteine protease domain-containing protein [Parashewanella spongiae]MCL1076804.1 YopT-type cysteine protease domain-containing protein [Parashewanella spongiae]RJY19272.1 hypothetical protein D5R81_01365 [Parashewanella spongiae]
MDERFSNLARDHDAFYVHFEQYNNRGLYRGPSGLSHVAYVMGKENDESDGYCLALSMFTVECNFSPDRFLEDHATVENRGKIRGYQKITEMLTSDGQAKFNFISSTMTDSHTKIQRKQYIDLDHLATLLSSKNNVDVILELRSRKSAHAIAVRLGGGKSLLSGGMFFDPNFGFAVFKKKELIGSFFKRFMNEIYYTHTGITTAMVFKPNGT